MSTAVTAPADADGRGARGPLAPDPVAAWGSGTTSA